MTEIEKLCNKIVDFLDKRHGSRVIRRPCIDLGFKFSYALNTNAIVTKLLPISYKNEAIIAFCVTHEFKHFMQSKIQKIFNIENQDFLWKGKKVANFSEIEVMDVRKYMSLPWERDANDFAMSEINDVLNNCGLEKSFHEDEALKSEIEVFKILNVSKGT